MGVCRAIIDEHIEPMSALRVRSSIPRVARMPPTSRRQPPLHLLAGDWIKESLFTNQRSIRLRRTTLSRCKLSEQLLIKANHLNSACLSTNLEF